MKLMSPEEFSRAVREYADRVVPTIGKEMVIAVAGQLQERILTTTPVLTGHARHNWQVSLGEPMVDIVDGVAGVGATGDPLTAEERANISALRDAMAAMPLGEKVFIRNNLPYIQGLDQGTSQKAPAGIVDVAIHASLEDVKRRGVVSRVE